MSASQWENGIDDSIYYNNGDVIVDNNIYADYYFGDGQYLTGITETDPKVGTLNTNKVPKWSTTTLVDSTIYDDGTNVGVGTTSPIYKLQVDGTVYATTLASSNGVSTRIPYYDTDKRLTSSSKMTYDDTTGLEIAGIIKSNAAMGSQGFVAVNPTGLAVALNAGASNSNFLFDSAGGFSIQPRPRASVLTGSGDAGSAKLTINGTTGYVGIGMGATYASYPLQVNGNIAASKILLGDLGGYFPTYYAWLSSTTGQTGMRVNSPDDDVYVDLTSNQAGGAGKAMFRFADAGSWAWAVGNDGEDDNRFKISLGSDLVQPILSLSATESIFDVLGQNNTFSIRSYNVDETPVDVTFGWTSGNNPTILASTGHLTFGADTLSTSVGVIGSGGAERITLTADAISNFLDGIYATNVVAGNYDGASGYMLNGYEGENFLTLYTNDFGASNDVVLTTDPYTSGRLFLQGSEINLGDPNDIGVTQPYAKIKDTGVWIPAHGSVPSSLFETASEDMELQYGVQETGWYELTSGVGYGTALASGSIVADYMLEMKTSGGNYYDVVEFSIISYGEGLAEITVKNRNYNYQPVIGKIGVISGGGSTQIWLYTDTDSWNEMNWLVSIYGWGKNKNYFFSDATGLVNSYQASISTTKEVDLKDSFGIVGSTGVGFFNSGFYVGAEDFGNYIAQGYHHAQIIAPFSSTKTPLVLGGGSSAVEIWKDSSPSRASGFGMAVPGQSITNDFIFSSYYSGVNNWIETMRLTNADGVNTSLIVSGDVQGDNNLTTKHAVFSDTTTQTLSSTTVPWAMTYNTTEHAHGITLGKSGTVTISKASPAVISWNGHGLYVDSPVVFSTTGALPTGLTAGTKYYIISAGFGANSFRVSATPQGTAINTSTAGSGTHTATNSSIITVAEDGCYGFIFSTICAATAAGVSFDVWFRKNGTNIDRTNTRTTVANANNVILSMADVAVDLVAGDKIEMFWVSSSTNGQLQAVAAQSNPTRPATPSTILTIKKISK